MADNQEVNSNGYVIKRSDGTTEFNINKGVINSGIMSIPLIGQNASPYGPSAAKAWVWMLENFAYNEAPKNAIPGQLWYNTEFKRLYVNVAEGDETEEYTPIWDGVLTELSKFDGDLGTPTDPYAEVIYARHFFAVGGGENDAPDEAGSNGMFIGTATQAEYADIAERFHADKPYEVGTVVKIGGEHEITETNEDSDYDVFGVISENPAFMMNAKAGTNETHPYVAFAGRVPVKVCGTVKKGQRLVSSAKAGTARAVTKEEMRDFTSFQIIGRAIEDKTSEQMGTVMVVVGAK